MSDVFDVFCMLCPWPHKSDRASLAAGRERELPRVCRACAAKSCIARFNAGVESLQSATWKCEFEVSCFAVSVQGERFLIVGVYNPENGLVANRDRRRSLKKGGAVNSQHVLTFIQDFSRLLELHRQGVAREVRAAVAPMHDIKTMVGVLWNGVDAMVRDLKRRGLGDDSEWARAFTRIQKTSDLLLSRLRLSDVMNNPAVAAHGQASPRNLYNMCYRLVKCFEDNAKARGIEVWARGASQKEVMVKDSFESIPYLLIENAVKHSTSGTRAGVYVQDNAKSVTIEVRSVGSVVPEAERDKIYRRGYRGTNAAAEGSGLGLWCAQVVAQAHSTRVEYAVKEIQGQVFNCFSVEVRVTGDSGDTSTSIRRPQIAVAAS